MTGGGKELGMARGLGQPTAQLQPHAAAQGLETDRQGQASRSGTRSDHADCQPLTVGGAVTAQDAALMIDGCLAVHD